MKTCGICVEQVNPALFINCPKCNNEYCHNCFKQYVNTLTNEIKCMCCTKTWDQAFIYRNLPLHIVYSVIKEKRIDILYEQEKAMLPIAQFELQQKNVRKAAQQEIYLLKNRIRELKELIITPNKVISTSRAQTIVCGCPISECRGFITKPDYSCGMCNLNICKECHQIVQENHECNKDDVETVKVILATTKSCPGCGATSRKTEGCNQVWCMVCKKAWNWTTGQLEYGAIHATDFLNYLRKNGQFVPRAVGDEVLDRCTLWQRFPLVLRSRKPEVLHSYERLINIYQRVAETSYIIPVEQIQNNTDIAIMYLENRIDEKKWRFLIMKRDKQHTFNVELSKIKNAFFHGLRDMFTSFVSAKTSKEWHTIVDSIFEFHDMIVYEYYKLAIAFKSKKKCPF